MGSLALLSTFIFVAGFFQDARGERPEMFPADETLFVRWGDEIRIECYSKEAKLQFSFPEAEVTNLRSDHKMLQSGNGTYTFLRSDAVPSDAGWYACAEENIEIDNHFTNLNHTHKDISWIYVYVGDGTGHWFTDVGFQIVLKTIIVVAGSTVVVPCRPSSPTAAVELWQNFEHLRIDGTAVKFDPKIGFIMKEVNFEEGEAFVECRIGYIADSYVLRLSGKRPTMITAGSELTVQEGTELKIECKSETKLSFMFPERFSDSSKYEIFANESGVKTFLRRSAVADDTGWYGCAGEGIQNDIPYQSINYTRREISWIYVYVNSTVPITSGLMVFRDVYPVYVIIPCRPTSPGLDVQLISWRNGSSSEHLRNVPFDSKLGFVLRRSPNEGEEFSCTTNEPVDYVPKIYHPTFDLDEGWFHWIPAMVDADDPLASKNLSIRMTGEDLHLLCEAIAPKVTIIRLEWIIPSTVSEERVQYHGTRAVGWDGHFMSIRGRKSMVTIRNISETDSGDYSCFARVSGVPLDGLERMLSDSRHVEVFDQNGGRYMKLDKQGGAMEVRGLKGETVKWLLDLENVPSAKISWFDVQGHLINVSDPYGSRHVNLTSRRGSPHLLFTISNSAIEDSGVYRLSTDIGNVTTVVHVTVIILEPPLASVWTSYRHPYTTEENITAKCRSYGHPQPDVKFSFLNLPKFPSRMNSKLTDLNEILTVYAINDAKEDTLLYDSVTFKINVSGVVICKACNPVNCSLDEEEILYSVSDEPYFTSTNLNRSEVTVNREIDKRNTSILECYAAGRPYPEVTWFKGNRPLQEDKQFKFSNNKRELSILFFVDGDSGRYMCRAENKHGKVENYVDIKIEGAPNVLQTSLIIAAAVLLGVIGISWVVIGKLRIEATRRKLIDSTFKNGALNRLNPELSVVDQAELLPYDLKWEFPRDLLTLDKILGSGAFGIVKKAEAKSIRRGEPVTTVAVKLVRSKASLNFITALTRELKILVYLGKHINVVNLLGACTRNVSNGELFVIVEYCRFGNLHDYLIRGRADFIDETRENTRETSSSSVDTDGIDITDKSPNANDGNSTEARGQDTDSTNTSLVDENCTSGEDSSNAQGVRSNYKGDCDDMNLEPIRTRDLVYWSWQVSRGMDYLGKRKVVHGDLAARNILLAENGIVKISDFGLSKALYEEAQYRDQGVDPLPVKWMAPESIKDRVFSYQSDIWSFGIVMWEFFTLAKTPYPGIKCRELYQQLVNGHRMEKPEFATNTQYDTMLNCWDSDPSKRPSFFELAHSFDDSLDEGFKSHYLDMISTYIEINADMFENRSKDYLTLSPSTFDAPASTKVHTEIEMDSLPRDESTNSE